MKYLQSKMNIACIIALGVLFLGGSAHAKINRTVEPVVVSATTLPELADVLEGIPLDNVVLYSYNALSGTWQQVVVQIDEYNTDFGGNMQYFHPDQFFGAKDELVFMASAAGDQAPMEAMLDDATTYKYPRYEIKLIDDLSNDSGYVYLFRTDNPAAHPLNVDYINWTQDQVRGELVVSDHYEVGHDVHGHISNVNIPTTEGGLGVDFFDRMKIRVIGSATFLGQNLDVSMTEGNLEGGSYTPDIVDGPIRIIRKWNFDVRIDELGGYKVGPYSFIIKYYPYSADFGNATFSLGGSIPVQVSYVRLSFDMNSNANGMRLWAPKITDPGSNYPTGVPIDRVNDAGVIPRDLDVPGWNWWMHTGLPGTFLTVSYIPNIGQYQYLYYKDDNGGTNDPATYGTTDTGDGESWGDTGFKVTGPLAEASIPLGAQLFFLGPSISKDSANTIKMYKEVPLKVQVNQNDNIPPAQIADFVVHSITDSSLSLSWTAVGDDGTINGPASWYILRYSDQPVTGSIWDWWATAINVWPLPAPSTPGQRDSVTITGLDKNKMYYFVLRAVDESRNAGDLTQVTLGTTTPVELASFSATPGKDGVQLAWATASETNNLGFAVERQAPGADWQEIAFLQGAGSSNQTHQYAYLDAAPSVGEVNYRLKQIDSDGSFEYSFVVTVSVKAPGKFQLAQNFPNPFNPTTTIRFDMPDGVSGDMSLVIYDLLGREVKTLLANKAATPGVYNISWDGTDDAGNQTGSGVYLYALRAGEFKSTKKMIKIQ